MSSIRLFVLDAFERYGEMHGYELKPHAERERIDQWTDISVGAIYGVIKRIALEGLLAVVRTERAGNRPERQVFAITEAGRAALVRLRRDGIETVTVRADPFDFALSRTDPDRLDDLPTDITTRLDGLRRLLADRERFSAGAAPHLTLAEIHALRHREYLLRAEIAWHEELVAAAADIVADERERLASGTSGPHAQSAQ
jgi:DNA-binding PadR family transcriptional regulator